MKSQHRQCLKTVRLPLDLSRIERFLGSGSGVLSWDSDTTPPPPAERKELTPQETSVSTAVATVVSAQGISYLHTGAINKSDLTHPVCPAAGQNVCRWVHLTHVHAWCEVLLPYQETSFIFWRDKSVDLGISSRVKGPTPCIYLLFCSVSLVGCISIWDEALEHWEVAQPSVVCI